MPYFKKKVTFILIDQHDNQHQRESVTMELITGSHLENFKRPAKKGERRNGLSSIRIPEKFYSRLFLVDDTLFIQAEVGPKPS